MPFYITPEPLHARRVRLPQSRVLGGSGVELAPQTHTLASRHALLLSVFFFFAAKHLFSVSSGPPGGRGLLGTCWFEAALGYREASHVSCVSLVKTSFRHMFRKTERDCRAGACMGAPCVRKRGAQREREGGGVIRKKSEV